MKHSLRKNDSPEAGLARLIMRHADEAERLAKGEEPRTKIIHGVRVRIKRVRALLRRGARRKTDGQRTGGQQGEKSGHACHLSGMSRFESIWRPSPPRFAGSVRPRRNET